MNSKHASYVGKREGRPAGEQLSQDIHQVTLDLYAAAMSSVRSWRTFVGERLAAAAEEIVGVFEETLSVYEEEVSRQRRLLDVVLKPEIRLHRTGV